MKPREQRRKVLITARMCVDQRWVDVCILNMSSRGLGLQTMDPPGGGTYVEVRRGRHVMVGRVAWSKGHRFGLRTQDFVQIEAILREPDVSGPALSSAPAAAPAVERRAVQRPRLERHESSRIFSRAFEYAFGLLFGLSGALAVFQAAEQTLAAPLAQVSAALAGQ